MSCPLKRQNIHNELIKWATNLWKVGKSLGHSHNMATVLFIINASSTFTTKSIIFHQICTIFPPKNTCFSPKSSKYSYEMPYWSYFHWKSIIFHKKLHIFDSKFTCNKCPLKKKKNIPMGHLLWKYSYVCHMGW